MTPTDITEEARTEDPTTTRRPTRRTRLSRADWTPPARTPSLTTVDPPPPPPPTDGAGDHHGGGGGGGGNDKITVGITTATRRAITWLGEMSGDDNQTVVNRALQKQQWAERLLGSEAAFEQAVMFHHAVRTALSEGMQILVAASGQVIALSPDGSIRPIKTPSF